MAELITQTQQPQPTQPPQQGGVDPVATLILSSISVMGVLGLLIKQYIANAIASKQERQTLDTQIIRNKATIEIKEQEKELERINQISEINLDIVKNTLAAQQKLLDTFVAKHLDNNIQLHDQLYDLINNFKEISGTVSELTRLISHIQSTQRDILNVLKMHERAVE
jgi:predicted phage tail protein